MNIAALRSQLLRNERLEVKGCFLVLFRDEVKVRRFRMDDATGEVWPEELVTSTVSVPPTGSFRVTNLYVNATGKLVVEYDDQT